MDVIGGKVIRDRNWFITINPQAECYIKFKDILNNQKNVLHYAYIYHKADEDNSNDNHIHLCIEYKNQRTFEGMQNIFIGSHIEHMKFKSQSYKYLIHKGYDDKLQYSIDNVFTNDKDYYSAIIETNDFERLDTISLLEDIKINNFDTITDFIKKYGINQVKTFHSILKSVLYEKEYFMRTDNLNAEIEYYKRVLRDKEKEISTLKDLLNDKSLPF